MSSLLNGSKHVPAPVSAKRIPVRYSEPAPIEKLNWLIHLLHVREETVACKELIRTEIANSSARNEFLFYKQGLILRDEGNVVDALDSFQICLKLNPENKENMKEVGACLYELRRYKLALDAYKEAERISEIPDWQIFHRIAEIMVVMEDVEQAKKYITKAVEFGRNEMSFNLLVKILKKEGVYKSALSACRSAIESCPDSLNMLCEAGFLHLKMLEYQHAFERLSDALALDPSCSRALLGIGCITQTHGEIDVALSKYKIAIQSKPNSVALWNNIGLCFYSKEKYIAAMSCLKRALWISPLNWRLLFNLGLVHISINQPASAFNFLCAAVNLRPDVAHSFSTLGYSLISLYDPENALRAFDQAILLLPTEVTYLLNAALCAVIAGSTEKYRSYWQTAESLMENQKDVLGECAELRKQLAVFADHSQLFNQQKTETEEDSISMLRSYNGPPTNEYNPNLNQYHKMRSDEV